MIKTIPPKVHNLGRFNIKYCDSKVSIPLSSWDFPDVDTASTQEIIQFVKNKLDGECNCT